jgi:hypothetical protein
MILPVAGSTPQIFRKCSCINEFSKSLIANGGWKDFSKMPGSGKYGF